MKVLKRVVSIIIWTVIGLNAVLFGATQLPMAQRWLASVVAQAAAKTLGTEVTIEHVGLGLFNRMILDGAVVYDQQGKQMLRAARLTAKVDVAALADGKIVISSAQLFGANLRLYRQDAASQTNFQFVVDSLSAADTLDSRPLDLRINSLIIRHTSLSYDQLDQPATEQRFNPAHLAISDISTHINLKRLTDDSLNVNVKRLSLREQSGLQINRLAFRLEAGLRHMSLRDFVLQMPSSQLRIDTLVADYKLENKQFVAGSLRVKGGTDNSYVTPSDLRCFEPALKNFQRPVNILLAFEGTDEHLAIPHLQLSTNEQDIDISLNGWGGLLQQPSKPAAVWQPVGQIQLSQLSLSENNIDFLVKTFGFLPKELTRIGQLSMNGSIERDAQGLAVVRTEIETTAGQANLSATLNPDETFSAEIVADDVSLQQLTKDEHLGRLDAALSIKGKLHEGRQPDMTIAGDIAQIDYNGYHYSNITLSGNYQDDIASGQLEIADPNVEARLYGQFSPVKNQQNHTRQLTIDGAVERIVPSALGLTDRWQDGVLSGNIEANLAGSALDNVKGTLRINNLTLADGNHQKPYVLDNLVLTADEENGLHTIMLKSDFADAVLQGDFDYSTLPQSITRLVASRLPTLPGLPAYSKPSDNNFALRLLMTKADWLQRLLGINLQISQPLLLNARVNDYTEEIQLQASLPAFSYAGGHYSDADIDIYTHGDSLSCKTSLTHLMSQQREMDINLFAHAANNQLSTSFDWDNHHDTDGQLNTTMQFYRNMAGHPESHIRIRSSHINLNNEAWDVEPSDIIYQENHLLIDEFTIRHGQQHITIDGIASHNPADSIRVGLNEIDIAYILDLVDFTAVEFSGKASGKATVRSLFDKMQAQADLRIDDFKFENGRMGVLNAQAVWNDVAQQIDIHAIADDGPGIQTLIDGYVSPVHNTIDLGIQADSTYIDFIHNFTNSFLSQVSGHADGAVRLAGTLDNINLTGELLVTGEATVTALNTTYYLKNDTVRFIPDEILLRSLPLDDGLGHEGWLSGAIHHRHLTNLTFDLSVEANNLLAYDFKDFGDNSFCGTVYATGHVELIGRPGEVTINCDVTPEKNSVFTYNASTPDALVQRDFIQWEEGSLTAEAYATSPSASPLQHQPASNTNIYLNILINATPDATLRLLMDANTGDYITLNGEGALRTSFHNKGSFQMFGTYTVSHGTYDVTIQNILKKDFTFNPGGTIVFAGDPYQAALQLQAVHTVSGVSLSDLNIGNSFTSNMIRVNCLMNIGGRPEAPNVEFDLEMPTVNADEQQMIRSIINGQQEMNQQVVYLLSIGRFYIQGANNADQQQGDQTSLAMQSLLSGALSTQLNAVINQFVKNDNWKIGANIYTGNEGWHNAEYEGIINGRMLNNRLLVNGQFGYRDNATQATPSFIGDFDIQYLLYPNGNLALKVYNQTNDRYFTRSSLNTQGLGIIMKKDFNGLRDLFSRQKKKKKK